MRPSIVYLVSEDWYFLSHRLPMARAARDAGYAVHVITRVVNGRARIEREGFVVHDIDWRRGSLQPLHLVCLIVQIRKLYRRIRPDIVHHVAIAAAVLGSAAALGLPIAKVNALAGLGFVFTSTRRTARLLRPIARWTLK